MGKKTLIPPEKWEGLRQAMEEAAGTSRTSKSPRGAGEEGKKEPEREKKKGRKKGQKGKKEKKGRKEKKKGKKGKKKKSGRKKGTR